MADVMIKCPETGESVATGIGMDYEAIKQVEMRGNVAMEAADARRRTRRH